MRKTTENLNFEFELCVNVGFSENYAFESKLSVYSSTKKRKEEQLQSHLKMDSLGNIVAFVTGPMTAVVGLPSGLRNAIDGSFIGMRRPNHTSFRTQVFEKSKSCSVRNLNMMAENPLSSAELDRRQQTKITADTVKAAPPRGLFTVPVAELQLPRSSLKLVEVDGRTQIVAEVSQDGIPYLEPPKPTSITLTTELLAKDGSRAVDLPGSVPSNVSFVKYLPTQSPREGIPVPKDGQRRKRGGTIFGVEDRYAFIPNAYPWHMCGQIRTAKGRCSGTIVGPRHVLTASHCVNWGDPGEQPGWINFTPAYYDGNKPFGEHSAETIISILQASGGLTDQETAFDYVVLVMTGRIGDLTGYAGSRKYNGDWNDGNHWQYIGYAGDLASGERPAFQGGCAVSSNQAHTFAGHDSFVLGHFNDFTPGQSGGCAWGWWADESFPRVVGVGSTIGSTAVEQPHGSTIGDNEYGGGEALNKMIAWARKNFP